MAIYIVGDVQGCLDELLALLAQVKFTPVTDQLWLAGDLVARGSKSLETLRYVKSLKQSACIVLGNHDLHILAIHAGIRKAKPQDNLSELLSAPDVDELLDWLSQQPLLQKIPGENAYMSHAGISPQWTLTEAIEQAQFAHKKISSEKRKKWLRLMYGEQPNSWSNATNKTEKFRYTINALTRMRYCYKDGSLDFACKDGPNNADKTLRPWFELSEIVNGKKALPVHLAQNLLDEKSKKNVSWIFGHWAALMGKCKNKQVFALDTGCVWGNHLTLLRWEDKKIFKQDAIIENIC